ncbi:unnamed protein product [Brassica rapa]|uniref:MTHFR SAM-binding regulatory domain-containing protein n=1 Tax=Brassica campestris TaxID=3711 RepID=A0A8D9GEV7_BRACM|nr:unnamed protein product [Brassica rapa]
MPRDLTPQLLVSNKFHLITSAIATGSSIPLTYVGWGSPAVYVYQKAYLEFLCSKKKLDAVVEICKALPCVAATNKGANWPTIVDPARFKLWKDEAFETWPRNWANLYTEADPSKNWVNKKESFC